MKDLIDDIAQDDDIDHLVDALLAEPGRADDIKALLRHKIAAPDTVRAMKPLPKSTQDEADDLWDNVPV